MGQSPSYLQLEVSHLCPLTGLPPFPVSISSFVTMSSHHFQIDTCTEIMVLGL